jgi:hypothetical protein
MDAQVVDAGIELGAVFPVTVTDQVSDRRASNPTAFPICWAANMRHQLSIIELEKLTST